MGYRDNLNAKQRDSLDRLEQLRDREGYKGWIDQDGKKAPCPSCGKHSCTAGLAEKCI